MVVSAEIVANQENVPEQVDDLSIHRGNEIGDGGEMGPGIGEKSHKDHILPAGLFDPAAGDDAPRVGVKNDLQQNPGIVGRGRRFRRS